MEHGVSSPEASTDIPFEIDSSGIATLSFGSEPERPGPTANMLSALDRKLTQLEVAVEVATCRAVIFRLDGFDRSVPMDLSEILAIATSEQGIAYARRGQRVLRRIEQLPVPTVAAIRGECSGFALELSLACGYRIAADSPRTGFTVPEPQMGLTPLFGASVRLPHLLGLQAALEFAVTGRRVDVREAQQIGLIDHRFQPSEVDARTRAFVAHRIEAKRPRPSRRRRMARRIFEDTAPGRKLLLARTWRRLARLRGGQQLSVRRTVELMAAAVAQPLEQAFEAEAKAFGEIVFTDETRGLLHSYRLLQPEPAAHATPAPAESVAIVGGGSTSAQATHLLAFHRVPVRLKAQRHEQIARAAEYIDSLFRDQAARGILSVQQVRDRLGLIRPSVGFGGFGTADLAILEVQRAEEEEIVLLLREIEDHIRDDSLLALVPPHTGVSAIQPHIRHGARLLGLHLFPLPRIRLVEIVRGEHSAPATIATAVETARRIGKTPIVTADAPGFVLHRLAAAYINEALFLLEAGATVQQIDATMRGFGMAQGPLRLLDEVGLDWYAGMEKRLTAAWGPRLAAPAFLSAMIDAGRTGRKSREGFYRYTRTGEESGPNPALYAQLHPAESPPPAEIPAELIQRRIVLAMIAEATHLLSDGIVDTAAAIDIAALHGLGFPARRGGLLWYADRLGSDELVEEFREFTDRYGDRFRPSLVLSAPRTRGAIFYHAAMPDAETGQGAPDVLL
jgi:3-hydroxyacyl-CoA dehydrogenase / enoyl-CoA hydratase / 3-hydroxybutyryl-CoA epimerase